MIASRAIGFHREHAVRDARADRRSQQPLALERRFGGRQARPALPRTATRIARAPRCSSIGCDAAVAAPLPFREESLPQLVKEPAALERRSRVFVLGLFFEPQHLGREEPERAIEVALEPADRHARQVPGAGVALESDRTVAPSSRQAHRGPAAARRRRGRPAHRGSSASASDLETRMAGASRRSVDERPTRRRRRAESTARRRRRFRARRSTAGRATAARCSRSLNAARALCSASRSRRPGSAIGRQRLQQRQKRRWIEDVPPDALGPFAVDQPDELHVVEVAVASGLGVDNLQARLAGACRKRLAAEPSSDAPRSARPRRRGVGIVASVRMQQAHSARPARPLARATRRDRAGHRHRRRSIEPAQPRRASVDSLSRHRPLVGERAKRTELLARARKRGRQRRLPPTLLARGRRSVIAVHCAARATQTIEPAEIPRVGKREVERASARQR